MPLSGDSLQHPVSSAPSHPKPVIQGLQTAIVVGQKGKEIDPDKYGRVKVQFHWIVTENATRTALVGCGSPSLGGKKWGAICIPRLGQEVLVELSRATPTGPSSPAGSTTTRPCALRSAQPGHHLDSESNSSLGGDGFNEIRFEDKKGQEQIFMHGEKNLDVRIKNDAVRMDRQRPPPDREEDQIEHVENNRDETVDADHKEKIGKDRHLQVAGKEAKAVDGSKSLTSRAMSSRCSSQSFRTDDQRLLFEGRQRLH